MNLYPTRGENKTKKKVILKLFSAFYTLYNNSSFMANNSQ